jgi:hypothetical protein
LLHNHAATKITALKDIPGCGSGATATATTMVTLERYNGRTMPSIPLDVTYGRAFNASTNPATTLWAICAPSIQWIVRVNFGRLALS